MASYKSLLWLLLLCCMMNTANAQTTDTLTEAILPQIDNNSVRLNTSLRPLRQIAGAPAAFYSYFWEFGDGTYSFEKEPVHIYKDTGDYTIRLYATNNYDDGKKPNTKPRKLRVANRAMLADNKTPAFFSGDGSLEIRTNQQPKPGEDMVLLIGYRNHSKSAGASGSIMLLYNEKQFTQNGFDIADARSYHNEKQIGIETMMAWLPQSDMMEEQGPSPAGLLTVSGTNTPIADRQQRLQQIKQEMNAFRGHHIWRINELPQNDNHFLFVTVNTLPEMIRDTNAVVTITGLFIPDDPNADMEKFNLEMQVVASHDPNRMQLKNKKLNYRFTGKNKENAYKVQFQNTGKGPAKKVAVTITIPGLLNTGSLEIVDMKPACPWCHTVSGNQSCIDTLVNKDSIQFVFNNIYLPGTQQDGVSDPDSTKGYIKYRIRFNKKMQKRSFESRAAIVFDKNEPIYTNRSTGGFKKGISPGVMIGFGTVPGKLPADIASKHYSLGFSVSEYAAYRGYFQWELFVQSYRSFEQLTSHRTGGDTVINQIAYKVNYRDNYRKTTITAIEAVPVQYRYNFKSWLAAGMGALVAAEISKKTTDYQRAEIAGPNGTGTRLLQGDIGASNETFAAWRGALFADVQVGRVRTGPAIGVRFLQYVNPSYQNIVLYASWKF